MSKRNRKRDDAAERLRRSADDERRLLKRERRAERDVIDARADLAQEEVRLQRAQARVERSRAEVVAAEARLRKRQAARAIGPSPANAEQNDGGRALTGELATDEATGASRPVTRSEEPPHLGGGDPAENGAAPDTVSIAAAMGVPNV